MVIVDEFIKVVFGINVDLVRLDIIVEIARGKLQDRASVEFVG